MVAHSISYLLIYMNNLNQKEWFTNPTCAMKVKVYQSCTTLWSDGLHSTWNSSGINTGVDSISLLQGIFPTQGSNPGLPHCRQILYKLNHKGSLRILEWVAYPFSRGSSQPRNWTRVSCIAGRFFTNWAIREALVVSFATPWAYQAPLSMVFPKQEY